MPPVPTSLPTGYPPALPYLLEGADLTHARNTRDRMRRENKPDLWGELLRAAAREFISRGMSVNATDQGARRLGYSTADSALTATTIMLLDIATQHTELGCHVTDLTRHAVSALLRSGKLPAPPPAPLGDWLVPGASIPGHPIWHEERTEDGRTVLRAPIGFSGFTGCVRLEHPIPCTPDYAADGISHLRGFYYHISPGDELRDGQDGRLVNVPGGTSRSNHYRGDLMALVSYAPHDHEEKVRGSTDENCFYNPPLAWRGTDTTSFDPLGILPWVWKILDLLWHEDAVLSTFEAPKRVRRAHPSGRYIRPMGPWRTLEVAETLDRVQARRHRQRVEQEAAEAAERARIQAEELAAQAAAEEAERIARASYFVRQHESLKWVRAENATETEREEARAQGSGGVRENHAGTVLYRVTRAVRAYQTTGCDRPITPKITLVRGPSEGLLDT